MKKYRLLNDDFLTLDCGATLYRVQALRDLTHPELGAVAFKGELGGYIYDEKALSHEGNSWVAEQAQVISGHVSEDALVRYYARVFGGKVYGSAIITHNAIVGQYAQVFGSSILRDESKAIGHSKVIDSKLTHKALAEDNALIKRSVLAHQVKASSDSIVKDATISGNYVVHNETIGGIDKGKPPAPRYGCEQHSNNYIQEREQFEKPKNFAQRYWGRANPASLGLKYRLTKESKQLEDGITVYRIKALRALPEHNVKRGDKGGWIQSENNLAHLQGAWVSGEAIVRDNAMVTGCAYVGGEAVVSGNALLTHQCVVRDMAHVSGSAHLMDTAMAIGHTTITGNVRLSGMAVAKDNSILQDNAQMHEKSIIEDSARLELDGQLRGDSRLFGTAIVIDLMPRGVKIGS